MRTTRDGEELARSVAAIVREHVQNAFAALCERIAAIEKREIPRGEKGDRGDPGHNGEKGDRGDPGPPGPAGDAGARGEKGEAGEKGERGPEGPEGKQGRDGRDGLNGLQGERGERGADGKDGRDGVDGKDGLGFGELQMDYDGERTVTFKCVSVDGQEKELGTIKLPIQIYRGLYMGGRTYEKHDCVTYSGSQFTALEDTDLPPEGKNSKWKLSVKRGQHGQDGKPGERGERGPAGPRAEVARAY